MLLALIASAAVYSGSFYVGSTLLGRRRTLPLGVGLLVVSFVAAVLFIIVSVNYPRASGS